MSVIRVGSNTKYADGWDAVFGKGPAGRKPAKASKKAAKKKVVAKTKAKKPAKSRRG
jgi:hypothetical protein